METKVLFPHRQNLDRTFDSICPECFRTIASSQTEDDLEPFEDSHICRIEDVSFLPRYGSS